MKIRAQNLLLDDEFVTEQTVHIEYGKIIDIYPSRNEAVEHDVHYLVPSYIDLQVNGGGGVLLQEGVKPADVLKVVSAHSEFGSGFILPTLITNSYLAMQQCADAVIQAREQTSAVLGVHFEGPWLAKAKKGIHLEQHIRAPSDAELALISDVQLGKVLITLAPETVPVDVITDLVARGVVISLGHSNASHEQVLAAIEAGASGFTHLYNAMSGLQGRDPGMVGVALGEESTFAGLIVDHHHVNPYAVRLAYKHKSFEHLCLVTDAMAHVGSSNHVLPYFDTQITQRDGKLTTPEGALAGSCLTMHEAVLNLHRDIGVPLEHSMIMASRTPANWLGLYEYGRIGIDMRASLLGINSELLITSHWRDGVLVK